MAESARKPWYAAALAGGFGAVLGVATLLGLPSQAAHSEPRIATSSLAPGAISLDERLTRIEQSVDASAKAIDRLQRAWDRLPEKCKPRGIEQ